ncbi:CopG family ribbon-helix-helix protein [Sphingorhabdus profundilacus]|uniref:CopG family ribbon-helix-helix protein n=1 Tax=Sphingorhabdus profundilacus TaxID=2509718 RepID=UPI001FE65DEF|nr:CopG family ribbon-helix-helix protein [Sphingorhabdus profundilacus]
MTETAPTSTMTIRVTPETKAQLGRLAQATKRSRAFLAGEAVAHYVAREVAIVEGIKRGLNDINTGNLVPNDIAMEELSAVITDISASGRG